MRINPSGLRNGEPRERRSGSTAWNESLFVALVTMLGNSDTETLFTSWKASPATSGVFEFLIFNGCCYCCQNFKAPTYPSLGLLISNISLLPVIKAMETSPVVAF